MFSPIFTSMHPAGGQCIQTDDRKKSWIPNKDGWPAPEGNKKPPKEDPLYTSPLECTSKKQLNDCLLYTSPSPRDGLLSRMPSSA